MHQQSTQHMHHYNDLTAEAADLDQQWQQQLEHYAQARVQLIEHEMRIDEAKIRLQTIADELEEEAMTEFFEDKQKPTKEQRFSNESARKRRIRQIQQHDEAWQMANTQLTRMKQQLKKKHQVSVELANDTITRLKHRMDAVRNDLYCLSMIIRFHCTK